MGVICFLGLQEQGSTHSEAENSRNIAVLSWSGGCKTDPFLEALRENRPLSWPLAVADNPWHSSACTRIPPTPASTVTGLPLCLRVSESPLLTRTPVTGLGPNLIQNDLALTCKEPISKEGFIYRFQVDTSFGGTLFNPVLGG